MTLGQHAPNFSSQLKGMGQHLEDDIPIGRSIAVPAKSGSRVARGIPRARPEGPTGKIVCKGETSPARSLLSVPSKKISG